MSNNVVNVEYEDVLSSIRRLVSEEVRARETEAKTKTPMEESDGKLLLSQALRVIPAPDPALESKADASEMTPANGGVPKPEALIRQSQTVDDAPSKLSALEATIAELEAAVSGKGGFEPDGDREETLRDRAPAFFRSASLSPDPQEPGQSGAMFEEFEVVDFVSPVQEDIFAEKLPFVAGFEDDVAQAPSVASLPQSKSLQIEEAADPQDTIVETEMSAVAEVTTETTAAVEEDVADVSVLSADVDDDPAQDSSEEVLLDEETLRMMIQSMVREELQGTLGEVITRNLRKLIRREIHAYFDVNDNY